MEKQSIRFSADGDPSLLVIEVPNEFGPFGISSPSFAIPIMKRRGGLLVAMPMHAVDSEKLIDEMSAEGDGLLGPSKSFTAELLAEGDDGASVLVGTKCRFMVVDFSDEILLLAKEYVPAEDDEKSIVVFDQDNPTALPSMSEIPEKVKEWASSQQVGRANFYSAREEPDPATPKPVATAPKKAGTPKRVSNASMAEQLAGLQAQLQMLMAAQKNPALLSTPPANAAEPSEPGVGRAVGVPRMPSLSSAFAKQNPVFVPPTVKKAAALVGPPPKTATAPVQVPGVGETIEEDEPGTWQEGTTASGDPLLQAIAQQGSALTALVAHLTSGTDAMADLSGAASSSQSASTRGVQRREKLQNELASGGSNFFQLLLQQLHRRMFPSRPMPRSEEGFRDTGVSLLQYLEKFGGYRHDKTTGG